MKTEPSDYEAMLDFLGCTIDEVADALRARGIRGKPRSCWNCPIANLMKAVGLIAYVGLDYADLYDPMDAGRDARVTLPTPVSLFIGAFDLGLYPDLEEL